VTNTGAREGIDTPQLYLQSRNGEPKLRLLGWNRVRLAPGETQRLEIEADLRLLADFDPRFRAWKVEAGEYRIFVGNSAWKVTLTGSANMAAVAIDA